jgi:hypothetical protein
MLPELPKARRAMFDLWMRQVFFGFDKGAHRVSNLRVHNQREGNSARIGDSQIDYRKISATYSHPKRFAEGMTSDEFIRSARELGDSLGKQRLEGITDELERNPNSGAVAFDLKTPITFDSFLVLVGKVRIDFDSNGAAILPEFNDERVQAKIIQDLKVWLQNPEFSTRWDTLIQQKRKDFNEREAHRRLVD